MTPLLEARGVAKHFPVRSGLFGRAQKAVRAVDDVSFVIEPGATLGLVGESGCGKSVTGLSLMRLIPPPGRIVTGEVVLRGRDLLKLPPDEMRKSRGEDLAMIFQEPMTALNPAEAANSAAGRSTVTCRLGS